jgi:hypothetical protein
MVKRFEGLSHCEGVHFGDRLARLLVTKVCGQLLAHSNEQIGSDNDFRAGPDARNRVGSWQYAQIEWLSGPIYFEPTVATPH